MQTKHCANCKQDFTIDNSDEEFYKRLDIPCPAHCPNCRQQRRLAWRNERTLYKRSCDATGKHIISVYKPKAPFPVYDNEYWYSDKWNPLDYGRDFDFSRPFFEQFAELMRAVPQLARSAVANENCDYVNQCGWCKDCYMIFEADFNRDCFHSNNIYDSRDCMDIFHGTADELCYECVDCTNSYDLNFSQDCKSCANSWFCKACVNCKHCFGCINLHNKEYHFFNQKLTRGEYEKHVAAIPKKTPQDIEKIREKFFGATAKFPQKAVHGTHLEDSTGDYLYHTQRCYDCYDIHNCQDCKWVYNARNVKMVYDMTVFGSKGSTEFCCDCHEIGMNVRNIFYSDQVWEGCHDIWYSKLCIKNCHNLFGCVGLQHQSYCIFNKKYAPKDYESLKTRIIEHMKTSGEFGEFFPMAISPYDYEETIAPIYYPKIAW